MACINPISVRVKTKRGNIQYVNTSCGHCLNCMIKKESQVEFLAKKELLSNYRKGLSASFVTLTYDDDHIPYSDNGFVTLRRSDLQKFIKRMRRNMDYHHFDRKFKFLYCGEYGDGFHSTTSTGVSTCRPHYHIVFIGLSPEEVKYYTRKLWRNGLCDVGPLGAGGIRYLCKYMMKSTCDKDVKVLRSLCHVENPFFYHSIGLGKEWVIKNLDRIVEDGFTFNLNGKINLFPKHIMRFVSAHTGTDYLPYVRRFIMNSDEYKVCKSKGISFDEYKYEIDFINYKYKVAALRSQNKPINDFTMSKKWIKPYSSHDRQVINSVRILANQALRVSVPF